MTARHYLAIAFIALNLVCAGVSIAEHLAFRARLRDLEREDDCEQ